MVVLVLTRTAWSTDNNAGNTLSSLFAGIEGVEFHSLYLREGPPKNPVSRSHFHLTERQLMAHLLSRAPVGGEAAIGEEDLADAAERERALYAKAKRWDSRLLWLAREALWRLGPWRGGPIDAFLDAVKPDIVFMPAFDCVYPFRVLEYVARRSRARTVLFHTDDNVTLRQFRWSPLWWVSRLWLRRTITRAARAAALNYCITDELQAAYEPIIQVPCRVLRKPADFGEFPSRCVPGRTESAVGRDVVHLCYTGNLSSGRWEVLYTIGRLLDSFSAAAVLEIFSHDVLSPRMKRAFDACDSLMFMSGIPFEEIPDVQARADVLVHVESLRRRERLATRLAFSTKLVDYFLRGRCILAVGWSESASIAYLARNDAAVVATSPEELRAELQRLVASEALRCEYGAKAWRCGKRNHDGRSLRTMLHRDLELVASGSGRP